MKKLNAFQLKIIAVIFMLADHLYLTFPGQFPFLFHTASRFVAPLFAFLVVEGLFHTRNKLRYNIRLFGWAVFMSVGNHIINTNFASKGISVENNIFFTFAIGLTVLNLLYYSKGKSGVKKVALSIFAIWLSGLGIVGAEGGDILIPFMIIAYSFRDNIKLKILIYITLVISLTLSNYKEYSTFLLLLAVVPFILLYNGERGPNNKFSKYLFYVFYPLHLWILAIIQFFIR